MRIRQLLAIVAIPCGLAAQSAQPLPVLPVAAVQQLSASLDAAAAHARSIWRDTPPFATNGMVNAYVEIARGDRRKWEFDIRANALAIDRIIPEDVGGYPVNYGFVPQTLSYDGDPFDALVLGPALHGGDVVRGVVVGLLLMEDEKGIDSKVVLAPVGPDDRPLHELTSADRDVIADYFRRYKLGQPGRFSKVAGWGSVAEGRAHVTTTHAFFQQCRRPATGPCQVKP
jgi:inorganic pyrophosphatase